MISRVQLITALSLIAVLLVTVAVYWQGLNGPFLLDDFLNIVESHVDYFNKDEILHALTHNQSGELGRPVSVMSLLFTGIVHGADPWGFKYHNLALHLINGLLIFWLLLELLPRMTRWQPMDNNVVLVAGLTAAAWLLHPLLVSTVLYAVQRMAQLAALFTLAALVVYVKARAYAANGGWKFYLYAFGVFPLFLALAVFSKENGALTVFYILAIELTAFGFHFSTVEERNRLGIFLVLFVALPILLGSVYVLLNLEQVADYSMRTFTMGDRLLTQLHIIPMYLKMIMLPRLSDMTLFHDYIQPTTGFDPLTILLLCLFVAAVFLVFYLRVKAPVVSFAIAWFFVSHLMESTFFNLELMFEHRNYLAAVGPLLLIVYGLSSVPAYPKLKFVNAIVLFLLVFLTMARVQEWQSDRLIYEIALEEHPDSNRALTLMANVTYREGDIATALGLLQAAQVNDEKEYGAWIHEAIYRCGSGDDFSVFFDKARAKAAQYPASPYTMNVLDNAARAAANGRCPEIGADAVLAVIEAAKSEEKNQVNQRNFGYLENIEGQVYLLKQDYGKGIELMISAYDRTGNVQILVNLARSLMQYYLIGDAEYIVSIIEQINEESNGTESAVLLPLKQDLEKTRQYLLRVASEDPAGTLNEEQIDALDEEKDIE